MTNEDKTTQLATRGYTDNDHNFILATWLRGLYYGDSWFSVIPKNVFMENYHRFIENRLKTPGIKISVVCLKDDPEVILGYSVSRTIEGINILDWIFVKSAWRNLGIAKSLIPQPIHAVSHLTKVGKSLKPANVIFNPFI